MKKLFLVVCLTTMGLFLSAQNIIIQQNNNKNQQQTKVIERVVEKPIYIEKPKPKPKPTSPILLDAANIYVAPEDFDFMSGSTAKTIIKNLNNSKYLGYNDWRIPTDDEYTIMKLFIDKLNLTYQYEYQNGDKAYLYLYKCNRCGNPRGCICSSCGGTPYQFCSDGGKLRLVRTKQ